MKLATLYNEIKLQPYSLEYVRFFKPFVSSPSTWVFCPQATNTQTIFLAVHLTIPWLVLHTRDLSCLASCVILSPARLIYCSIIASPEKRMIYSATVNKMDHWPRSSSVGRTVPNRKCHGTERLRRAVSQPEGNVIIIPISWSTYWGILYMSCWSNPGGGDIFLTRPDRPWGPPSVLYNGCRVFHEGKSAGSWHWAPTPI